MYLRICGNCEHIRDGQHCSKCAIITTATPKESEADRLRRERDEAIADREKIRADCQKAERERDEAVAEKDRLRRDVDQLERSLGYAREVMLRTTDPALSRARLHATLDNLHAPGDSTEAVEDRIKSFVKNLRAEARDQERCITRAVRVLNGEE